jgi:PadR family transcriptional regulator, regulatory protein PadR
MVLKMYYFCPMNTEKTISQMRKGVLEFCILAIISKNKEVYASDILEQLKNAELIVVEGTLYPLLTRLKNDGLLSYRWEESKTGPPRKYYQITETGTQLLNSLQQGWDQLVDSVNTIVSYQNQ